MPASMTARPTGISPQGQEPGQAGPTQGAPVSGIQPMNTVPMEPFRHLVHRFLHGDEILAGFAVTVVDHLQHMKPLRQKRHRIGERLRRFRRAGQKQQRLFLFRSVFQNSHDVRSFG